MPAILNDLRRAVRTLRKSPIYTLVAIITLAVGIGANTAIFSISYALLLRRLPVPDPERIVTVGISTSGPTSPVMPGPMIDAVARNQSAFTGMCGWGGEELTTTERGETRLVNGAYATGDCFSTLQLHPQLGRLLNAADDQPGGGPYGWHTALSYDYWRAQYGGDLGVIGRGLVVNGQPVTIVGVLPEGFHGLAVGADPGIIVPSEFQMTSRFPMRHSQDSWYLQAFARLKPGVNRKQAEAQLRTLQPLILNLSFSAERLKNYGKAQITVDSGATGWGFFRRFVTPALMILHAVAGILLLVICIDVGMLISARNATRRYELAIRSALGASRARIVLQLFTENLLIGCLGAGAGAVIAASLDHLLVEMLVRHDLPLKLDVGADMTVQTFTAGTAVFAVLVFGLLPALRASKLDVSTELKAGSGALVSMRKSHWSKWLVPVQIALSVILVVLGSLFSASFIRLIGQNPGFRTDNVLLARVDFNLRSEKNAALRVLYREMLDRLAVMPGIEQVSFSELTPLSGSRNTRDLVSTDAAGQSHSLESVLFNNVAPNFFRVMGTNVLAGRDFNAADAASTQRVCVLSDAAARYFFPGQNPLGQVVRPTKPVDAVDEWTVVGVVENLRSQSLRSNDQPAIYFNMLQPSSYLTFSPTFVIRSGDPATAARQFQQLVREIAPETPLVPTVTLSEQMQSSVLPEKLLALFVGSFSAVALFLSAITLYGLLANNVASRVPEIGLRLALGAQRGRILTFVLREALWIVIPGMIAGTGLALLAGQAARSMLYDIPPQDPWTFVLALTVTLTTSFIAALVPARRAAMIEPIKALRTD